MIVLDSVVMLIFSQWETDNNMQVLYIVMLGKWD
jgi:hypothetical protein